MFMATIPEKTCACRTRPPLWKKSCTRTLIFRRDLAFLKQDVAWEHRPSLWPRNSPQAMITAVDISEASAGEARRRVAAAGLANVQVLQGDIFNLLFQPESFDHLFICFVLEHLSRPVEALCILMDFVKPGGTITAIEGIMVLHTSILTALRPTKPFRARSSCKGEPAAMP